ncbi:aminoglycoside 6-adenylyltransferase [bacterium]|nr:aminoglycoside 6-adenylyltransferase [bacterium]
MRTEQEMFDLILGVARQDKRVRAVIMNGSRANPNAPKDPFQDFDIVYVVTEIDSFRAQPSWINCFGYRMILQIPDDMEGEEPDRDKSYAYLIQFADGNRIDLTLFAAHRLAEMDDDSQSILLLDKDGIVPPFPPASDRDYLPKPPTARQFADCCNEFWWVSVYVAKGLWRREILYALDVRESYVRPQLMKMITWFVGIHTDFAVSPGKSGKYLERLLPPEEWQALLRTWSDADYEHAWDAQEAMSDLFRAKALSVAEHFGFAYPHEDDQRVCAHLRHVRALPGDAKKIY